MKCENTAERTFNSASGRVRDPEYFRGGLARSHSRNIGIIIHRMNSLSKDGESHENKTAWCLRA